MRGYGFLKCLHGETTIQEVLSVTAADKNYVAEESKPTLRPRAPVTKALAPAH